MTTKDPAPTISELPELPEPIAHMAGDFMRAITETELALIPNTGEDKGRRDRCRLLYRKPLFTAAQMHAYVLADRAARRSTEGWQPIETAPKGQNVLLYRIAAERISVDDWGLYDVYNQPKFTYWMPPPPAPTGAAEEKGQES